MQIDLSREPHRYLRETLQDLLIVFAVGFVFVGGGLAEGYGPVVNMFGPPVVERFPALGVFLALVFTSGFLLVTALVVLNLILIKLLPGFRVRRKVEDGSKDRTWRDVASKFLEPHLVPTDDEGWKGAYMLVVARHWQQRRWGILPWILLQAVGVVLLILSTGSPVARPLSWPGWLSVLLGLTWVRLLPAVPSKSELAASLLSDLQNRNRST